MERLVKCLRATGAEARVFEGMGPAQWRYLMSSGRAGRLRARADALLRFPMEVLRKSVFGAGEIWVPTTNPFILPWLMVMTQPLHGRMVVPLIYDLYPDAFEAADMDGQLGPLAPLAAEMNRQLFARADGVVFIGQRMADHVARKYGEPKRWTVIETGAEASEFSPAKLGDMAPETALEDFCQKHTTLSYVGAMGSMHDVEAFKKGLPQIVDAHPKVGIVIAASGIGAETLRATVSHPRIRFVSPLPDRAWARLLAMTDISLVSLKDQARHTSCPSKAYSALAAGCALVAVAPDDSDLADLVTSSRAGVLVEPGDGQGLVAEVRRLLKTPRTLASMKRRAREVVATRYDMSRLAVRWEKFLSECRAARSESRHPGRVKRLLDMGAASIGLAATAPLLAGLATAVRATMGSPVLFSQDRPGLHGETFKLKKFRTMRDPLPGEEGPESDGKRMTRLGRFMRKTSLDELPTLLNVLRGDMTLVGPRPLLVRYLDRYNEEQARRHHVRPGITGWAQVIGRNATTWDARFVQDVWYVDNRTLWRDLQILLMTVRKVLIREGISQEGHATMPEFMGTQTHEAEVIPLRQEGQGG